MKTEGGYSYPGVVGVGARGGVLNRVGVVGEGVVGGLLGVRGLVD